MTTPNQQLRQVHLEAQEVLASIWDVLICWDGRLPRPHIVQLRQRREAQIAQSFCFSSVPETTLFLQALMAQAKGDPAPEGAERLELVSCPEGYVFKEVEPPKRTRKPSSKTSKSTATEDSVEAEVKPKRKRRTQAEIAAAAASAAT